MGRIRVAWGLFAFAATFVAFLVLWLTQPRPEKPQAQAEIPVESLVATEVSARYGVPSGAPIVTKISDLATLAKLNPTFYASLRDGDWLVRYPGLLIAYRREEGRIVSVERTP